MNLKPPKLAERLLAFFAGTDLKSEVLGDLHERFIENECPNIWYWSQTIRSIPEFCLMHARNISFESLARKGLLTTLALALVWLWELYIAQKASWPIAKHLLAYSPLSAAETCKAAYLAIYGIATASLVSSLSIWNRFSNQGNHLPPNRLLLLGVLVSTPIAYHLLHPTPYGDTLGFRLSQGAIVWGCILAGFAMRMNYSRFNRLSKAVYP